MNQGKQAMATPVLREISATTAWVREAKSLGLRVGFVPTMGALHAGHAALIKQAAAACDRVVVSIFVNPTQFNDHTDFENYPLTPEADLRVVEQAGGHAVFMPDVAEIYGGLAAASPVDYGDLTRKWEAADRPGHFDGVVAIVDRLFRAVRPDAAFFGEKDLQQLAVVRRLAQSRHPEVEVVGCALVRDADGLALSSRNVRLTDEARQTALAIPRSLRVLANMFIEGAAPLKATAAARQALEATPGVEVAYFDLVHRDTFSPWSEEVPGPYFAVVAATVGGVRLLDNHVVLP
jgi:pantoate--beta-alanine ligase